MRAWHAANTFLLVTAQVEGMQEHVHEGGGTCRLSTIPSTSHQQVPGTLRGLQPYANAGSLAAGIGGSRQIAAWHHGCTCGHIVALRCHHSLYGTS